MVEHPAQWRCSGYHELCGRRQRYRVLDKAQLVRCLGHPCDQTGFAAWYQRTLEAKLASGYLVREALWTECVAVGGQDWVQRLSGRTCGLRHEVSRHPSAAGIAEDGVSYGLRVGRRIARGLAASLAD